MWEIRYKDGLKEPFEDIKDAIRSLHFARLCGGDGFIYRVEICFMDIKLLKKADENKSWFRDKQLCLKARVERLEAELKKEKYFSDELEQKK